MPADGTQIAKMLLSGLYHKPASSIEVHEAQAQGRNIGGQRWGGNTSISEMLWGSAVVSGSESDGESMLSAARHSIVCPSTHVVKPGAPFTPVSSASLSKKALNHLNLCGCVPALPTRFESEQPNRHQSCFGNACIPQAMLYSSTAP